MRSKKYLGVFFGTNAISIVETEAQSPARFSVAEYSLFQNQTQENNIPDPITQTAILQKTIREQKISSLEVNLSVPSKDVIFRSFIIPWMANNEIKAVIDFESRKYIPFKLNELAYIYHPVTMTDKDNKFIRIFFAAVKSDILENYCKILEDSGLRIKSIEPAPLSLIRVLMFKKLIPKNQRMAIVQSGKNEGNIIIVDQGVPQFIRDFQLQFDPIESDAVVEGNKDLFGHKLYNEIKISLEYYSRQYSQDKVTGITILSESDQGESFSWGEKELGIPISRVNAQSIFNVKTNNIDLLNAYGIGLKNTFALPLSFDLPKRFDSQSTSSPTAEKFSLSFDINIKSLLKIAGVCFGIVFGAFFLLNLPVKEYKKKLSNMAAQEGMFQYLNEEGIDKKYKEILTKLDRYKNVRTQSNVTFFLSTIPRLLPDGTWIKDLNIIFPETTNSSSTASSSVPLMDQQKVYKGLSINISGYAFTENINQQMRLVNNFVSNLKKDEKLMSFFSDVRFTTETVSLNGYTVTSFKIECN